MFILVREIDSVIVGTAMRQVDEVSTSQAGCRVYEIEDSEWTPAMLGAKLTDFTKE